MIRGAYLPLGGPAPVSSSGPLSQTYAFLDNVNVQWVLRRLTFQAQSVLEEFVSLTRAYAQARGLDNWYHLWLSNVPQVRYFNSLVQQKLAKQLLVEVPDLESHLHIVYKLFCQLNYGRDAYGRPNLVEFKCPSTAETFHQFLSCLALDTEVQRLKWVDSYATLQGCVARALLDALREVMRNRIVTLERLEDTARGAIVPHASETRPATPQPSGGRRLSSAGKEAPHRFSRRGRGTEHRSSRPSPTPSPPPPVRGKDSRCSDTDTDSYAYSQATTAVTTTGRLWGSEVVGASRDSRATEVLVRTHEDEEIPLAPRRHRRREDTSPTTTASSEASTRASVVSSVHDEAEVDGTHADVQSIASEAWATSLALVETRMSRVSVVSGAGSEVASAEGGATDAGKGGEPADTAPASTPGVLAAASSTSLQRRHERFPVSLLPPSLGASADKPGTGLAQHLDVSIRPIQATDSASQIGSLGGVFQKQQLRLGSGGPEAPRAVSRAALPQPRVKGAPLVGILKTVAEVPTDAAEGDDDEPETAAPHDTTPAAVGTTGLPQRTSTVAAAEVPTTAPSLATSTASGTRFVKRTPAPHK